MKVRVFSTPACSWCRKLEDFLRENNIEFEEIDISQNKEAVVELIEKTGQRGVPVIEIDGEMLVGFNREKISEKLGLENNQE